jgi:hypothetical protein
MPAVQEVVDPDRLEQFLGFATERHRVWERRQMGQAPPWTDHPVLASKKFTNVYRVLDYGSQWLFRSGWISPEASPRNQLMRLFLYRHTGRWEAWDVVLEILDRPPLLEDLPLAREILHAYKGEANISYYGPNEKRNKEGGIHRTFQRPVFTSAYLVFPQSTVAGTDKLDSIFDLTLRLFTPGSPDDIVPDFLAANSQPARFRTLRRNKGVADFMSMQILTDWGYTPQCGEDREDEFVVPGPGARKGSEALAPRTRPEDVVRWVQGAVHADPGCPHLFVPASMSIRPPSLMDVQNLLCEFSKLVRYTPNGVAYKPSHPGPQPAPALPVHW